MVKIFIGRNLNQFDFDGRGAVMGMFDRFEVAKGNKVGIPDKDTDYQSKDLGCTLAQMSIDVNGLIEYTPPEQMNAFGHASDATNEEVMLIKAGHFCCSDLNIYGGEDVWVDLELVVHNNKILKVTDLTSGNTLYESPFL